MIQGCQRFFGGLQKANFCVDEPALKRVPAPYAKDHSKEFWLRHKKLVASGELAGHDDLETRLFSSLRG
jgi:hypothetical protein